MDIYLSLWIFIVIMVTSPGPANMLSMTSGAQNGFWPTVPFMIGLVAGKFCMNVSVAFGFANFLHAHPNLQTALTIISCCYLVYLSLQGWNGKSKNKSQSQHLTFPKGVLVHPLSPKTWLMSTLAYTQFSSGFETLFEKYALIPLSFMIVQITSVTVWCLAGTLLRKTLDDNLILHRALILTTIAVILWAVFYA